MLQCKTLVTGILSETMVSLYPVYTIQLVVKPVEQPVECLFTRCSRLFNQLFNRLYRVNGLLDAISLRACLANSAVSAFQSAFTSK